MGFFYSRKDYENEIALLDALRAEASRRLLAGRINGLQKLRIDREIEELERKAKGKLLRTRLALMDEEHERKNTIRVRKGPNGELQRFATGQWVATTKEEVNTLVERTGKELKIIGKRTNGQGEPDLQVSIPKWKKVSREEGKKAARAGSVVRWVGEGESGYAEVQEEGT